MKNNNLEGYDYGLTDVSLIVNRIYYAQENPTVESVFKSSLKAFQRINFEQKIKKTYYCFDGENNRRKIIFPEYKANRDKKNETLEKSINILFDFFNNGLGLTCFKKDGYEADDLIASLKYRITNNKKIENPRIIILSADKDLLQLLDDNCFMMIGVGADRYKLTTKEKVKLKYGIDPHYISTYLALMGDSADNFNGVDGIGPKTAVKLINEFGNYDSIIDNIDNIKSKSIKNKFLLMEDKYLPKKLAELVYDVDLKSSFSSSKNEEIKRYYMEKYNLNYNSPSHKINQHNKRKINKNQL